jgi:hypothetical protein
MKSDQETWTDEELAALPQTSMIFQVPDLNLNDHDLRQENYTVYDSCCNDRPFNIGDGRLLVGQKGAYKIVDELAKE